MFQALIIMGITFIGNKIQMIFDITLAGSIVGFILFFLLLQFKIIPTKWVGEGSQFFFATMVVLFVASVLVLMDVDSMIIIIFVLFFIMIVLGTCCVALISGFIAEKMVKAEQYGNGQD